MPTAAPHPRRGLFVGRRHELGLIERALADPHGPRVFLVHGAGGLGKTALLHELLEQAAGSATYFDARELEPTPDALRAVLARRAASYGRRLVLVDNADALGAIEGWVRESLLSRLPPDVVLVLARRAPPAPEWRALPGWGETIHEVPLASLDEHEAARLMERLAVPAERRAAVLAFAHGHPLAIRLCATALAGAPALVLEPRPVELVQTLVRVLVSQVPGAELRAALEAAAVVRVVSEPVLRALLDETVDAAAAFAWLSTLPVMDAVPGGLVMQELARDVLAADLRWRDSERSSLLVERAHAYYLRRLERAPVGEQLGLAIDALFLVRHLPGFDGGDWDAAASLRIEVAAPRDVAPMRAIVARHEGEESAQLAERWMRAHPEVVYAFRDGAVEPMGVAVLAHVEKADPALLAEDPAGRIVTAALHELGPLRPGETALLLRFGMTRDLYQAPSPGQLRYFAFVSRLIVTTPGLRYVFTALHAPEVWEPMVSAMGAVRDRDFEVGGRRYGVYYNDYRAVGSLAALRSLLPFADLSSTSSGRPPVPERLSRDGFARETRAALKDLHVPAALGRNRLATSRLVWLRAGLGADAPARARALRDLVEDAVASLAQTPIGARTAPVLRRTYLDPAPVQKQAAAALGLSWGSYRRHLAEGVEQVVELLWAREIS